MSIVCFSFSVRSSGMSVLNCSRSKSGVTKAAKAGTCQINRWNLLPNSKTIASYPLDGIHSASVANVDETSSLMLVLRDQEIVDVSSTATSSNKLGDRDRVNEFLKDPRIASVQVKETQEGSLIPTHQVLLIASGLILLFTAIGSRISICRFDKTTGKMSLTYIGLLGKTSTQYKLSEIVGAEVDRWDDSDTVTYRLQIRLTSVDPIPLTYTYDSENIEKQKLADSINTFLGLA